MLKIGKNRGKIANYPPQYSTKIGTSGSLPKWTSNIDFLTVTKALIAFDISTSIYVRLIFHHGLGVQFSETPKCPPNVFYI